MFKIHQLNSGGLITNYYCTSKCGHCLYRCSPKWKKEYIDKETTIFNLGKIKSLGCYSIHIGGGEPMLNIPGLIDVAIAARENGMGIDYVETNSSWFVNEEKTKEILNELIGNGVRCLLISISPFHNQYIPFYKVKGVLKACRETGMQVFPWVMDFYDDIDTFDDSITHDPEEYIERYGKGYFHNIPSRYWTHFGGRAVDTFAEILSLKPFDEITNAYPCHELTDTGHFHMDLFGNYIPGLCSGLAIKREDLGNDLYDEKYPFLNMLYNKGIKSLLEYAKSNFGFEPKDSYLSKCHLCNDIRFYLVSKNNLKSTELDPKGYYL